MNTARKVDVAVNIFAKPFQTALTLLSLARQSGAHISTYWLQFEPVGSKFDSIPTYHISAYLQEQGLDIKVFQPDFWLAREAPTLEKMADATYRHGIRYQYAFENSKSELLFITHNDVFFIRDMLGALIDNMGDAFAIGQIGQCWNCPAANTEIMAETMNRQPCRPRHYQDVRPDFEQLKTLYRKAAQKNVFVRPYLGENFSPEFEKMPWPLPECRVNEWALLLDLQKTRPYTVPFGKAWPPGAYRLCNNHQLDVVTPWFRDMHALGMHARHFNIYPYFKHWVGTGHKSATRYAQSEDNAQRLLNKYFPDYIKWLEGKTGNKFS